MRKLILSMMVSLDNRTARADGDLGWFRTDGDFELDMLELLHNVDGILLGRVSYELLAAYWPTAGTANAEEAPGGFTSREREVAFAERMNTLPKIVYSRTMDHPTWGPAKVMREVLADDVEKMKRDANKDLVLFAGATLASAFINLDLIDEYRLMVHPVLLGRGLPLFEDVAKEHPLRLMRAKTLSSGVVLLHYERELTGSPVLS